MIRVYYVPLGACIPESRFVLTTKCNVVVGIFSQKAYLTLRVYMPCDTSHHAKKSSGIAARRANIPVKQIYPHFFANLVCWYILSIEKFFAYLPTRAWFKPKKLALMYFWRVVSTLHILKSVSANGEMCIYIRLLERKYTSISEIYQWDCVLTA